MRWIFLLILCSFLKREHFVEPTTQNILHFYQQFFKKDDIVFDVGANIGVKTLAYLRSGAQVVAFEPQPTCVAALRSFYGEHPNVLIENVGLADESGLLELYICSDSPTITTFSEDWVTKERFSDGYVWDQTLWVPVVTLDEMIEKHGKPTFCKIDVEGFEYSVLKGLHQPLPYLSFEFSKEILSTASQCIDHLLSIGFTDFNVALGEAPKLVFDHWVGKEELLEYLENEPNPSLWGDIYARTK